MAPIIPNQNAPIRLIINKSMDGTMTRINNQIIVIPVNSKTFGW